jgi:hypothetical protein
MLIWIVIGHFIYYKSPIDPMDKDADMVIKLFGNVLLVMYLRLMQIIMISILLVVCCPLIIVWSFCGRRAKRAADQDVIRNLNLIPIEEYKLYKQGLDNI